MEHLAQQFVEERQRRGEVGPGKRVSAELRRIAVEYARRVLDRGDDLDAVASRLSVLPVTLERWLDQVPIEPTLREVVIRDELDGGTVSGCVTLVTPEGFRIEGLQASDLPALLAQLR